MAVPFNFSVTMGKAIESEVASRAAARVMIHIEMKAKRRPLEGLKGGAADSRGDTSFSGVIAGGEMFPDERLSESDGEGFSARPSLLAVAMRKRLKKLNEKEVYRTFEIKRAREP